MITVTLIKQDLDSDELLNEKSTSFKKKKQNIELDTGKSKSCDRPEIDNAAATKLQKAYKSYRTRRNLADCAVVVEELWWKASDFAALQQSSISFFEPDRSETAISRWARARTRVAKLGKGLSKDDKAQELALRHWLEAIDPRHRYGHNLHLYYEVWFGSESSQPFFYWLDVGDGKEVNVEKCCRTQLQRQCIKYLGPKERGEYEVKVEQGKLVYRQNGKAVETDEGTKWIFVLSGCRNLYVGKKEKGLFQHSSFLAGGAAIAAGRLIVHNGSLQAVWSYSGHYRPSEDNFMEFINFLEDNNVDLTDVKKCPMDDDVPPSNEEPNSKQMKINITSNDKEEISINEGKKGSLACKWSSGLGARIGCVREYPTKLQLQALEHLKLSHTTTLNASSFAAPIPSPRPSPNIHLSPRLACIGSLSSKP